MQSEDLLLSIKAALAAGKAILEIYSKDFDVEYKSDSSPLTLADKSAHQVISEFLVTTNLPILSEEGEHLSYSERVRWNDFWLVDPLDGTKEFVKRNGDFTVNIARIHEGVPVSGVIYAPVPAQLYFAEQSTGAYRYSGDMNIIQSCVQLEEVLGLSEKMPVIVPRESYIVIASLSHLSQETSDYIRDATGKKEKIEFLRRGSSLKFCSLAEGSADLYPRLGPTMEWDTAAGHAIAVCSGCKVIDYNTGKPLKYNKESLLNPWFIASR